MNQGSCGCSKYVIALCVCLMHTYPMQPSFPARGALVLSLDLIQITGNERVHPSTGDHLEQIVIVNALRV